MLKPLLALALLPTLASARIGETPDQCLKRYGKQSVKIETATHTRIEYVNGGLGTACYFEDGKCVAIAFEVVIPSRVAMGDHKDSRGTFAPAHIQTILEANKGGSKWTTLSPADSLGTSQHITEDGTIQAIAFDDRVIIQTTANIEARRKLAAPESIAKSLEGI